MVAMTATRKKGPTIQEKARALTVFSINEANRLACTSGTEPGTAYVVHHNGRVSTHCPCKAYTRCSHMQAVDWYLEAVNRASYLVTFNPGNVA